MTDTTPSFPSRRAALKAASSGFGYLAFAGLSTWAAECERPIFSGCRLHEWPPAPIQLDPLANLIPEVLIGCMVQRDRRGLHRGGEAARARVRRGQGVLG